MRGGGSRRGLILPMHAPLMRMLQPPQRRIHFCCASPADKWHNSFFKVMFWLNHGSEQACALFPSVLQVSGERFYADVAKDVLLYVSRDLSDEVNRSHGCLGECVSLHHSFSFCVCVCVYFKGADGPRVTK